MIGDHAKGPRLDLAPFVVFLREAIGRYGSLNCVAEAWGVPERALRRYLQGDSKRVSLTFADVCLTQDGRYRLDDLWPDIDWDDAG